MKKIVGSLVAAIALWSGTTAYVGSQMKENIEQHFNNINKVYADKGIQYKIDSYKKTFFESTAKIELEVTDPSILTLMQKSIKLPLVMEYHIEHGPIFFKNGIGFGAAKAHQEILLSSLLTDEAKTEFLKLFKDDITITSDMIISFLKNASYTASTNEIKFNNEGKIFAMTPLHMNGEMDIDTLKGKNDLKIASLEFKEEGTNNGLTVKNLLMNVDIDEFIEQKLMMGTIDLSIEKLSIEDDTNPKLKNINIATNMHMTSKKDSPTTFSTKLDGNIDFQNTKLPPELPDLKNIFLKMDMQKLGIKGWLKFQEASQEMQKKQSELFAKMRSNSNPEDMQKVMEEFGTLQEEMIGKIINSLNTLLVKDETLINYGLNIETKDSKKSNASIEIGYTGDMKFEGSLQEIALKAQSKALDMISLNVDLGLDSTHIKNLPNAEVLKQQIQMGVAQGFVKEENGKYLLKGYYKNQELIVNDNNLTATVLPLLMMATQGGGI